MLTKIKPICEIMQSYDWLDYERNSVVSVPVMFIYNF